MKALSLTQPWASLVAAGAKRFETRSWSTGYTGPLAIHAAKGLSSIGGKRGLLEVCDLPFFRQTLALTGTVAADLPLGQIVAVCTLAQSAKTEDVRAYLEGVDEPAEIAFGDYSPGRYAFELVDVQAVAPIAAVGALGLWDVPREVEALIGRMVGAAA
ncbi:MAG TPA: ASCH domain-containing protein [Gaiellaceae bacterium]|nr:ASCH domain-containing protein [Gaiellaceae bacterium]